MRHYVNREGLSTSGRTKSAPIVEKFRKKGMRSSRELVIEQWLRELGYNPEHTVEYGQEFDIYLRKQHIAFEFNGIAWHYSDVNHRRANCKPKAKDYHYNKTLNSLRCGVLLYHFWDFESTQDVKSQIKAILQGETISTVNVDKNPSLAAHKDVKLLPKYLCAESSGLYKSNTIMDSKPMLWKRTSITIYEFYNAGYL